MEKTFLIQRFTLLHDGSAQSWPATYLAFHITARLGALLNVLMMPSADGRVSFETQASDIQVGGRAAGIEVTIQRVDDQSPAALREFLLPTDSLLVPSHLAPDGNSVQALLKMATCPIWVLSGEMEIRKLAFIANRFAAEQSSVRYATMLSQRLQNPLTIIIQSDQLPLTEERDHSLTWFPLTSYSTHDIKTALTEIAPSLFFIPVSQAHLIGQVFINCVVYPDGSFA